MSETEEVCGRCGHPKAEHVSVTADGRAVLVCPTALFLKDELQDLIAKP